MSAGTQNVFKQIAVKIPGSHHRTAPQGLKEKKGGGRQKQVKKLNRQKYLEYKYAARDMLADPGLLRSTARTCSVKFGPRASGSHLRPPSNTSSKRRPRGSFHRRSQQCSGSFAVWKQGDDSMDTIQNNAVASVHYTGTLP